MSCKTSRLECRRFLLYGNVPDGFAGRGVYYPNHAAAAAAVARDGAVHFRAVNQQVVGRFAVVLETVFVVAHKLVGGKLVVEINQLPVAPSE